MSVLIIDEVSTIIKEELMLHDIDFPPPFVNMRHPDDYKITDKPIVPEYIYNNISHHYRLIFRISWKLDENRYFPMSFICDTGAPMFFYFNPESITSLEERIMEDEPGFPYLKLFDGKAIYSDTPDGYLPANILGLRMIQRLELSITKNGFKFNNCPEYL